jgi:hypothetical protein
MNRLFPLLILVLFLSPGCRKSGNNPKWERTYGKGKSMFIGATTDSGLISCGEIENHPYLINLDKNKTKVADYTYADNGVYDAAWSNGYISIATGSSKGKMLISCLDDTCNVLWDTTFTASFDVNYSTICYLGNGNLLAIASGKMDSVYTLITGLYCVWFNTAGTISAKTEIKESSYMLANQIAADNSGNVYIALTRKNAGSESKATVVKYDNLFRKFWETELYNNPNFGASSVGIALDNSGNIYVAGKTELPAASGQVDNSFVVSLSSAGSIRWKEYLENANSCTSVKIDADGHLLTLNQNCMIIYSLNSNTGSTDVLSRTFDACEPKNTTSYGWSLDLNYDHYLVVAGSNGGRFYICQKPPLSYTQGNN